MVITIPNSRSEMLKVSEWSGNLTGLSGTFTDRLAKVTDCMVIFPAQSVCHQVQSGSKYLGQAECVIQTGLLY